MKINSRLFATLGLIAVLNACGIVQPGEEIDEDNTPPSIVKVEPASLTSKTIDPNTKQIKLYFSETLDSNSISASTITITPEISFTATTASSNSGVENDVVVLTLDEPLMVDTTYHLKINSGIRDKAGNLQEVVTLYDFSTPRSFFVNGAITGLKGSIQLSLTADGQEGDEILTVNSAGESTPYQFNYRIIDGHKYRFEILHLDGEEGFCSAINTRGSINNQNVSIAVECDGVSPVYPEYSKWTAHGSPTESNLKQHWGIMRYLPLPASTESCAGITATDKLGVFSWQCAEKDGKIIVHNGSGEFNPGKGLTSLIDFSKKQWKRNKLIVKLNGTELTNIDSKDARWWNNAIYDIQIGLNQLSERGAIYLARAETFGNTYGANLEFKESHIILLTAPGFVLSTHPTGTGSNMIALNNSHYSWIEGEYTSSSENILEVFNSRNLRIHNARFFGSKKGSNLSKLLQCRLSNVVFEKSGGNGLTLIGDGETYGLITLENITSSNNAGTGIEIDSADRVTLVNSMAAKNGLHGIRVEGSGNVLNKVITHSNNGDGLLLEGSRNSFFADITSSANTGNGLQIANTEGNVKLSEYNHIVNATLTDNAGQGFSYVNGAANNNNHASNILDAFNSVSDCSTSGACENVDVFSVSNFSDNFVGEGTIAEDISNVDFSTSTGNHYSSWNLDGKDLDSGQTANGACAAGGCRIIDWSLKSTAQTEILGAKESSTSTQHHTLFNYKTGNALPVGSKELLGDNNGNNDQDANCEIGENCLRPITYLVNSVEIINDGIGNDNNLCEAGETCIRAPNIGAYQGHGELIDAEPQPTTPEGVILKQWSQNGI
ncbi:MAG: Ig-like domain-containing protein [Gammaproteobacteria bacterium]|nr:Ig-like domain-containing protein [Gammaproteobacteria bacterium]